MAVVFANVGTAAVGTTSITPAFPTGVSAGMFLLLLVANKYPPNNPSTPADFTFLGQYEGGQGASGVDAGSIFITAYGKVATGSEAGTVTVSIASGNSGAAAMHSYVNATGLWDVAVAGGSDNSAGVTWLITGDVDPGFDSGDVLVVADAINADLIGFVDHSLTIPGVVTGAIVVGRASQSWTNGDDGRLATHDLTIASGPSSGVITWTFDRPGPLANAPAGASMFVRLREVQPPDPPDPTPTGTNVVDGVRLGRESLRRIGKMSPIRTGQTSIDRANDQVVSKVNQLLEHPLIEATPISAKMQPGLNKIGHGMKREVTRFLWNTDLDGAVVSSRQKDNPHPDRDLWVWLEADDPAEVTLLLMPGV